MKIAIIDTYYPAYLNSIRGEIVEGEGGYVSFLSKILQKKFGTSDFYSRYLNNLGHEVIDIIPNCEWLQIQWEQEYGRTSLPNILNYQGLVDKLRGRPDSGHLKKILLSQIKRFKPEILYLQDLSVLNATELRRLKSLGYIKMVVGQIACPLPPHNNLIGCDLILTSFPHYVKLFRDMGIKSEYFRIGFDASVLDLLDTSVRDIPCSFVGGISAAHSERMSFLESLATQTDIQFFGYGSENLRPSSPIEKKHHGPAWALGMYQILGRSYITLNSHINTAQNFANNMRLYEATGCGALLITDHKENLAEIFEPGKEVVSYTSAQDAIDKINYYLANPLEGRSIALAGQNRTLREHTYFHRMSDLERILLEHLDVQGSS